MQPTPNPVLVQLPFFIFIFFVFYILIIRPQQKKQKEHQQMIDNIKKNDEIVTSGGIHAVVVNVKEKTFVVRVDESTKIEIEKSSVALLKKKRE